MAPNWFEPLPTHRQVRLLQIPRTTCDKGRVHERSISGIEVFDIDATPPYHALSYTWGETKPTQTSTLESNIDLYLTESLKEGLPYILARCQVEYLFIDQLCINQDNSEERSKQVLLMGEIFSGAESVLIWLGTRIEHQGILMWILDQLGDENSCSAFRETRVRDSRLTMNTKYGRFLKTVGRDKAEELIIATLLDVFRLPWFCRVWVIQEAVLASQATFILGSLVMSPLGLYEIATFARDWGMDGYNDRLLDGEAGCRPFLYMMTIRGEDGRFHESFEHILANHRTSMVRGNFHATDPRDYVYGVLGLREEFATIPFNPDYTLSTAEVFAQAASCFLTLRRNLDILNLCDGTDHTKHGLSLLPSWVPDWSTMGSHNFEIYQPGKTLEFSASSVLQVASCQSNIWSELKVKGKVIDEIQSVHTHCLKYLRSLFTGAALFNVMLPPHLIAELTSTLLTEPYIVSSRRAEVRILSVMFHWALRGNGYGKESKAERITTLLDQFRIGRKSFEKTKASWKFRFWDFHRLNDNDKKDKIVWDLERVYDRECMHSAVFRSCKRTPCRELSLIWTSAIIPLYELEEDAEIFSTANGAFGLGHRSVKAQDVVAILHGYDVPAVLRRTSEGKYQYVTGCYLENVMYGEAVHWSEEEADEIVLV